MPLIKDVVDAIHEILDLNLNTLLVEEELPEIRRFIFGEKELEQLQDTPVIYIFGQRSRIEGWRSINHTQPGWDATHEVDIGIVIEHENSDVIRRQLYDYTRLIATTVIDAYPADLQQFFPRGEIQIEVSPLIANNSIFMGDARVKFFLQRVETRE